MNRSYSKQDKEKIITQYESGVSITSIHNSTGVARSTLYSWINGPRSDTTDKPLNRGDYNKLKMHCEKLENMIQILKTYGCSVDAPLSQRYEVIKPIGDVHFLALFLLKVMAPIRVKKPNALDDIYFSDIPSSME